MESGVALLGGSVFLDLQFVLGVAGAVLGLAVAAARLTAPARRGRR